MPSRALDLASKSKAWRLQLRISSGKVDLQALSTDAERAQMQKEPEPESARGPHPRLPAGAGACGSSGSPPKARREGKTRDAKRARELYVERERRQQQDR